MQELPKCVDGLPNLCGSEQQIQGAVAAGRARPVFDGQTPVDISGVDSAFAVALHMHQPLIPAGGPDLRTAAIVGNLQWMLEHPDAGDNHNAPVFHSCYKRMGELIPQLLSEGKQHGGAAAARADCHHDRSDQAGPAPIGRALPGLGR